MSEDAYLWTVIKALFNDNVLKHRIMNTVVVTIDASGSQLSWYGLWWQVK